jgi:hypothetical protein
MRAGRRRVMFHLRGGNGELMGNFALTVNGALYIDGFQVTGLHWPERLKPRSNGDAHSATLIPLPLPVFLPAALGFFDLIQCSDRPEM